MMRKNRLGLASIRCQQTDTDHHQNYWAGADKAAHDNCITALQQVHSINFISVKMHDPPQNKKKNPERQFFEVNFTEHNRSSKLRLSEAL